MPARKVGAPGLVTATFREVSERIREPFAIAIATVSADTLGRLPAGQKLA